MAHPGRNAAPESILNPRRYFFATSRTAMGKHVFQTERNANLLIDTLRTLVAEHKFRLHDFVIMPDHLHLLLELDAEMTIEKAMQFVKGRFSHRMKTELGFGGEIWLRGFSEKQVMNNDEMAAYKKYIFENPVKARLVEAAEDYPYCFGYLTRMKNENRGKMEGVQGLKPA